MYETHPAAEIFPPMSDEEYRGLVEDMRTHGQREAIVIFEGKILDGRHRMLACQELGLKPLLHEWPNGEAPESYVVSVNLHRRHLSESQRGMVAAKMANMRSGRRTDIEPSRNCDEVSAVGAAKALNVARSTVFHAKKVLSEGTPEEVAAVESGDAAVSTTARKIRARTLKNGPRFIPLLKEMTPEEIHDKASALEKSGTPQPAVAKHLGIDEQNLRVICDLVLLSRNENLTTAEKATVAEWRERLVDTSQAIGLAEAIRPIVKRVFGSGNRTGRAVDKTLAKRMENFERAMGIILQTCNHSAEIDIPAIPADRLAKAIKDLKAAKNKLSTFIKTLENMQ